MCLDRCRPQSAAVEPEDGRVRRHPGRSRRTQGRGAQRGTVPQPDLWATGPGFLMAVFSCVFSLAQSPGIAGSIWEKMEFIVVFRWLWITRKMFEISGFQSGWDSGRLMRHGPLAQDLEAEQREDRRRHCDVIQSVLQRREVRLLTSGIKITFESWIQILFLGRAQANVASFFTGRSRPKSNTTQTSQHETFTEITWTARDGWVASSCPRYTNSWARLAQRTSFDV